jgi:hypothetical protein
MRRENILEGTEVGERVWMLQGTKRSLCGYTEVRPRKE